MFEFIKKLFSKEEEFFPGILDEPSRLGAIPQSEIVGAFVEPTFPKREEHQYPKYPYQFQGTSSSCVAHGMAKIVTVMYYILTGKIVKFAPGFYYTKRFNKPGLGMWFTDITKLSSEGNLPYDLLPTFGFNEDQMNAIKIEQYMKDCADGIKVDIDWIDTERNFKNTAATIELTKKPVKIWFLFGRGEFFGTKYPKVLSDNRPWHHEVVGVATGTTNGKQYIKIEDSADKESLYEKFIDEDFFNKRCTLSFYPKKFTFEEDALPKFTGSVMSMQDCLRADGLFPADVPSVANWGPLTDQSVQKFCNKYSITFKPGRKMWSELEIKLYQIYK